MKFNNAVITPKSSSADLVASSSQHTPPSIPKPSRQSSVSSTTKTRNQYIANQRRQNLSAINNDFLIQPSSSSPFSVPLLIDTMNTFFQTAQSMEEEIMLPSRLKDVPVEQLAFDHTVQPDTWHEIYTFVRDMRNQLRCIHPFAEDDDDQNNSKEQSGTYSNDDEGIILPNQDNLQFSSASSEASSDEYEHSSTSYDTIKDELKYHYYGLFRSLDNLTSMANRVTEKYREEYII